MICIIIYMHTNTIIMNKICTVYSCIYTYMFMHTYTYNICRLYRAVRGSSDHQDDITNIKSGCSGFSRCQPAFVRDPQAVRLSPI